ncbi:acyl-CoA dehydrogenase family protein, partial [Patulibacter sp. S7RM1-6]
FVDALVAVGSPAARERLLGAALRGERIGNALAERGGHHAQDLRTRLTAAGAGARIDGRKYYCTGAISARWIAVSALDAAERLVTALVPRDAPGLTVDDDWDVVGQRATVSGTTTLDAVPVEPELVLPYGEVFGRPQQLGARAQLVHTAIQVGIAGGALRDARAFLRTRARPSTESARAGIGSPVEDPAVLGRYGRAAVRVRAAEALLRDAADTVDEVGLLPVDAAAAARGSLAVAAAKAFATDVASDVAGELFTLCGASAADARHGLDRHWRNARTHGVHDPVDWKHRHLAAHDLADVLPPNHGQL